MQMQFFMQMQCKSGLSDKKTWRTVSEPMSVDCTYLALNKLDYKGWR